jgi:NDP-sugar pyrophosphorylase family protein
VAGPAKRSGLEAVASRRAVVLAGGLGTRLQPYTTVLPKPLMPIGDRPVLDIVVRQLRRHRFGRVTIATGHLAELIEAFFGDGSGHGIPVDYFREDRPLGTVGALALIDGLDQDFLVMNGDVLTDMDYSALLAGHRESGAAATVAVKQRIVQIDLGVLEFDDDGMPDRITGCVEKPQLDYHASMGVYCFSPSVLRFIEPGGRLDFPDLVQRLLDAGELVRGWRSDSYWLDIGRHDDYEQAVEEFDQMRHVLVPGD